MYVLLIKFPVPKAVKTLTVVQDSCIKEIWVVQKILLETSDRLLQYIKSCHVI